VLAVSYGLCFSVGGGLAFGGLGCLSGQLDRQDVPGPAAAFGCQWLVLAWGGGSVSSAASVDGSGCVVFGFCGLLFAAVSGVNFWLKIVKRRTLNFVKNVKLCSTFATFGNFWNFLRLR
jgi:hypothetical protein